MLWLFIFIGMGLLSIGILIFLVTRFRRFSLIRRMAGERKKRSILLAVLAVMILAAGLVFIFDIVNTAIILVHLGVIWLICDFLGYLMSKKIKLPEKYYLPGKAAVLITIIYLACGWYLAHHVWEENYFLPTDKQVGSLRVVQFADSHAGTTFHAEGFAEEVKKMQAVNPDLVLITGDYVDDDTSREDMIGCCEALGTLKTTYGVYFSFGNHDKGYYGDAFRGYSKEDLIAELEKNHVKVLQDETVLIDDRFYLVGRQDRSEEQRGSSRASMEELIQGLDPEKYFIVMDHQPHDYKAQEASGVDLVLSGHTHGGQFFPINYLGEWSGENDKTYGHVKKSNTNFIVTSGISDWAIKFKTGCKSEFVVVDIQGK